MTSPLRAMAGSLNTAALEGLASKGLLRRAQADLEAGRVVLVEEGPDAAEVQADGETVLLSAAGPARGRCTCPAAGVCRHALAALILLSKPADGAVAPVEAPPPADWSRLFEPLTIEALARFAGKAVLSRAMADEHALGAATVEVDDDGLAVKVSGESIVFLPGGGLETAVSSGPERSRKLRVAQAVIAARRALGLPELAAAQIANVTPAISPETDARLLAEVRGFLARAYRSALVFAPAALEEEARRLAVAGRIEAVPRLAAALLRIAGAVVAARRRSVESDPGGLLALLAEAQALTLALEAASPDVRGRLIGSARDTYDPVGDLALFGLGAYRWETVSGAHGLTAWFFDPAAGRPLSLTLARPDRSDPLFTAAGAYEATPVWGASLARLAVGAVELAQAQVSPRARLSTSKSTRARVSDWAPQAAAIQDWACAASDWSALEERLQRLFASRLGEPAPAAVPVVLLPHRRAPARFDELTQTLVMPVADGAGRWLGLTLANDGVEAERIDAIERLGADEPYWAILALATPEEGHIALKPYGLWGKTLGLLDFLPAPRPGKAPPASSDGILSRLVRGLRNTGAQSVELAPDTATRRLLERAWELLLRRAELGRGLDAARFDADCATMADELAAGGLAPLARAFRPRDGGVLGETACLNAAWCVLGAQAGSAKLRWMA